MQPCRSALLVVLPNAFFVCLSRPPASQSLPFLQCSSARTRSAGPRPGLCQLSASASQRFFGSEYACANSLVCEQYVYALKRCHRMIVRNMDWTQGASIALSTSALFVAYMAWRQSSRLAARLGASGSEFAGAIRVAPAAAIPLCQRLTYSHGGYMGAAIDMLRHEKWVQLLRELTPASWKRVRAASVAAQLSDRSGHSSVGSGPIMRILENNPVLAAFGVAQSVSAGEHGIAAVVAHNAIVVEWDVYLPDHLVRKYAGVLESSSAPASSRAEAADIIARHTVISHGSLIQTMAEGLLGFSMHESVLKSSGGMTAPKWLEIYLECLAVAAPHVRVHEPTSVKPSNGAETSSSSSPVARPMISVFLDVKSRRASCSVLKALVEGFNRLGVHVWGVGSFKHGQIAGFDSTDVQRVQAITLHDVVEAEDEGAAGTEAADLHLAVPDPCIKSSASSTSISSSTSGNFSSLASPTLAATSGRGSGSASSSATAPADVSSSSIVELPAPLPIYILSTAGEVIAHAQQGRFPRGAAILFNGGSMLRRKERQLPAGTTAAANSTARQTSGSNSADDCSDASTSQPSSSCASGDSNAGRWEVDMDSLSSLRSVATHPDRDLKLGLYTQESHLDQHAAAAMITMTNNHQDVFHYGLAYSGLQGVCAGDIQDGNGFPIPGWAKPILRMRGMKV